MSEEKSVSARELALDILMEILERGVFSHEALGQALGKYGYLSRQDRAFITRTVEGTLRYRMRIDFVLDRYSVTKTEKMKPLIRTLLRMSVYQILYMDRVPDRAVCDEAVKLAEKRRFGGLKGFVNGLLRNISREKERLEFPDDSVRYSMPAWLIRMWEREYGTAAAAAMMRASLAERPLCVRCNTDLAPAEEIIGSLRGQGVLAERHPLSEDCLYLTRADAPDRLEAFQKGWVMAQDFTSSCVAAAAGIRASDIVLDVCAAPGGKTVHAASLLRRMAAEAAGDALSAGPSDSGERAAGDALSADPPDSGERAAGDASPAGSSGSGAGFAAGSSGSGERAAGDASPAGPPDSGNRTAGDAFPAGPSGSGAGFAVGSSGSGFGGGSGDRATEGRIPRGHVYARDVSARKVSRIMENVRRCGYGDTVTAEVWDAREPDPSMFNRADVVIADLPCSGLGVISRKPDIKYRIKPEDIDALAALQREILSVVWQYVKPGGVLVYATCTVSKRENEENRAWFLSRYPFVPADIRGRLGEGVRAETMKEGYIRFLPGESPDDGFFLSVMKRTGPAGEVRNEEDRAGG